MTRTIIFIAMAALSACGGGGVDTKTVVAPDPVKATTASTATSSPQTQDPTDAVPEASADFDFSNFTSTTLQIDIPNDLIGQVNLKIVGEWDGTKQELFLGEVQPGFTETFSLNVPNGVTTLSFEYMAYDFATENYQLRIEQVRI